MRTPACPQTTGLPPDGQGYYTAHTRKGPCIRLSYHQIYGETRCKLKVGIREWLLMESSCQGFLPRLMEQGTEDEEDDARALPRATHENFPGHMANRYPSYFLAHRHGMMAAGTAGAGAAHVDGWCGSSPPRVIFRT